MCGIAGAYSSSEALEDDLIRSALSRLRHRGPNDSGVNRFKVSDGHLALGFTRLSIIDLSDGGHQPMFTPDGRYTMVFNGEIYNYRELREALRARGFTFKSQSDTEVLLAAWACWGVGVLPKLIGMFAFAVFDSLEQNLTLVRDAFGIKPLFYTRDRNSLAFASEIPALIQLQPGRSSPNLERLYAYLALGVYDDGSSTFYDGIEQLEPGHYVTVDLNAFLIGTPTRWWWPSIDERVDVSFDQAASQIREMLLENVKLHMRSDVPIGAALSGGIDSSAIVCAMRYLKPKMTISTFSYVARGSAGDEESYVDLVNSYTGAKSHKVVLSACNFANDFDDLIRTQGEPFGSTSIYAQYRVFKAAREAGVTVVLDGQGADELFAGYFGYPEQRLRSLVAARDWTSYLRLATQWSNYPGRSRSKALQLALSPFVPRGLVPLARRVIGHGPSSGYLKPDAQSVVDARQATFGSRYKGGAGPRGLVARLRLSLTEDGIAQLLRHEDRNSMRWSIESRVPFLTSGLAEYALSLPERYLVSNQGETKAVLRKALNGVVPDVILSRRDKIGFQTPERDWLKLMSPLVDDWLIGLRLIPGIRAEVAQDYVHKAISGARPFSWQVWRLINAARWAEINFSS